MQITYTERIFQRAGNHIELIPEFAEGLDQIGSFSHLILSTRLHKARSEMLVEIPIVDGGMAHVFFATRHMYRSNIIGFTIGILMIGSR